MDKLVGGYLHYNKDISQNINYPFYYIILEYKYGRECLESKILFYWNVFN